MEALNIPIKNFLTNPIHIKSESPDFKTAKQIATQKAKELCSDPMLLAWYEGKTGDYIPKTECGVTGRRGLSMLSQEVATSQ